MANLFCQPISFVINRLREVNQKHAIGRLAFTSPQNIRNPLTLSELRTITQPSQIRFLLALLYR